MRTDNFHRHGSNFLEAEPIPEQLMVRVLAGLAVLRELVYAHHEFHSTALQVAEGQMLVRLEQATERRPK